MTDLRRHFILRVVVGYVVLALAWIFLSDSLLSAFADVESMVWLSVAKGVFFVFASAIGLFAVLHLVPVADAGSGERMRGMLANGFLPYQYPRWLTYPLAVAVTLAVLLIRNNIAAEFENRPLLILFMFPIILSALLGGLGPGLLSTAVAAAGMSYTVLQPIHSFHVAANYNLVQLGFLIINGVVVSLLSKVLRRSWRRSEIDRKLLDAVLTGTTDAVSIKDAHGRCLFMNEPAARIYGRGKRQIASREKGSLLPEGAILGLSAVDREIMAAGQTRSFDKSMVTAEGRALTFLVTKGPILGATGHVIGLFDISRDITDRKWAENQLRKLAQAVEQSPESIVITDLEANIEYVNESFLRNTGYRREEVLGKNPRILKSGETERETYDSLWKELVQGRNWEGEFRNRRKDGSEYVEHAVISPIRQPDGAITHYLAVKEDITEKKRSAAEIFRLSNYDPLTALPNRAFLLERVARIMAASSLDGRYSALLLFNIDRFKTFNDTSGQAQGDALLRAVGERLAHDLRERDFLARLGGDEFGVLLPDLASQQHAAANIALQVAEKIHDKLRKSFILDGVSITITATIGIALFPDSAEDTPLDILRRANSTLHHSKTDGGGRTGLFEGNLDALAKRRFNTERELRHALASDELCVFLQPQVDAAGKDVGAEALVRWQHPERGLVLPGEFIPIAEESNLVADIDIWVLTEVCRLLARPDVATRAIRISVNISPRHFHQNDFVDQVERILSVTGADPAHLTLEVTEGTLIHNLDEVVAKMTELAALGIHFSLDDFGTGYSSFSYLKRLPIHEIKIDRSFVKDMTTDPNDASLVDAMLSVARHLDLQVVAEGVETAEQAAFLNRRGEVIHQGFYFGRPSPVADWLERTRGLN